MSRPPRLGMAEYSAGPFFLTMCTDRRVAWFTQAPVIEAVRLEFFQLAESEGIGILVYCFMPDHLHLLTICDEGTADVHKYVKRVKQRTGYQFSCAHGRRLWQEGYYDHALRENETLQHVIEYIVNNPVRAGLARKPPDYPHWGSAIWSREDILDFIQMPTDICRD